MVFPMPNATGIMDVLSYANTVTNDIFWSLIVLAVFITTYMTLKNWPTPQALAGAGFLTFIISLFVWLMSLVSDWVFMLSIAVMVGTTALLFVEKD